MKSFECFDCGKVLSLPDENSHNCPSCSSSNGQVVDEQRVADSLNAGAFHNFDLKTGKPAKEKK